MPGAEFGEGQFEQDLVCELRDQQAISGRHFRPTPPLENHLGYDVALHVHPVALRSRRTFRAGVSTRDPYFAGALPPGSGFILPDYWANSFLQMKVPYHVSRAHRATQKQWKRWGGPYFRIEIDDAQHGLLVRLEQQLGSNSVVRYATPCFWDWPALATRVLAGTVAEATHFQSPGRIGGHRQYTYRSPEERGIGFSEPEDLPTGSYFADLRAAAYDGGPQSLLSLVAKVWLTVESLEERPTALPIRREVEVAMRGLLGAHFDALLDPEHLVREADAIGSVFGQRSAWTLGALGVRMMTLERFLRERCGTRWSIFAAA